MSRIKGLLVWLNYLTMTGTADLHPGDGSPLTYYST